MISGLYKLVSRLGMLHTLFFGLTMVLIVMTPFANTSLSPDGWGLLWAVVIPAFGPLVFMVLMLDFTMCQIMKSQYIGAEQQRLIFIGRWNGVLAVLLTLVWAPVFLAR